MEDKEAQSVDDGGECESKNEDDFSFAPTSADGSPISADDIFQNGQIRPVFPIFNRDLLFAEADDGDASRARAASSATSSSSLRPPLKKLFFEERDTRSSSASELDELEAVPEGTYCEWSKKPVEAAPELRNKSNSTGSSKLWRLRDVKLRSNSDGKDAFVFLNPKSAANPKPSQESAAGGKSSAEIQKTAELDGKEIKQNKKDRAKLDGMYECILCTCCSTSCPSRIQHQGFISTIPLKGCAAAYSAVVGVEATEPVVVQNKGVSSKKQGGLINNERHSHPQQAVSLVADSNSSAAAVQSSAKPRQAVLKQFRGLGVVQGSKPSSSPLHDEHHSSPPRRQAVRRVCSGCACWQCDSDAV